MLFNVPDGVGAELQRRRQRPRTRRRQSRPAARSTSAAARSQLIDAVVEADEALMEKYLTEGDVIGRRTGRRPSPRRSPPAPSIPIFCTSAKKDIGVAELLDALAKYGLSPRWHAKRLGDGLKVGRQRQRVTSSTSRPRTGEFVGQVFKVVNDKFVGNLSFIRVLSGKLDADHPLVNVRTGKIAARRRTCC